MTRAPGIVLFSGWSTGPGAWTDVIAALPPMPVAHVNWWEAIADPAAAFAAAAEAANRAAGAEPGAPVIAVGWSLGGQIALAAAHAAPDRIAELVLVATPVRLLMDETGLGTDPAALRAMRQGLRRNAKGIVDAFWAEALAGDRSGLDFADVAPRVLAGVDARALDAGLAALADTDLRRILPDIPVPAAVIQGDDDRIVGVHAAQQLADGLPAATVLAVPGGGHALPLTHPRMIAEIVAALVAAHAGEAGR